MLYQVMSVLFLVKSYYIWLVHVSLDQAMLGHVMSSKARLRQVSPALVLLGQVSSG